MELKSFIQIVTLVNCLDIVHTQENSTPECCKSTFIVENAYLSGNAIKVIKPYGRRMCIKQCKNTIDCKSINHMRSRMECQLNSAKNATENQLIVSDKHTYVEMTSYQTSRGTACETVTCSNKEKCIELRDGTARCVIERCEEHFTVDALKLTPAYHHVGSLVSIPCQNRSDGYRFTHKAHRRYVCKSNGSWTQTDNTCKGFAFKIYPSFSNSIWSQARQYCINEGADLAILDMKEKNDAVSNAVENYNGSVSSHINGYTYFFIGMTGTDNGIYTWIDGQNVTIDGWGYGQPKKQKHCVVFRKDTAKWHDIYCIFKHNFICGKTVF